MATGPQKSTSGFKLMNESVDVVSGCGIDDSARGGVGNTLPTGISITDGVTVIGISTIGGDAIGASFSPGCLRALNILIMR